jgi:hypothetical protein
VSPRYDWRNDAACRDVPVDVFAPWDPGVSPLSQDRRLAATARAICARCPVRGECLADADGDRHSVRGGLTPAERFTGDKPRTGANPTCGSLAAYQRHKRRGEEPCDACRAARSRYERERRRVVSDPRPPAVCGTEAGYRRHRRNGEDACEACKEANATGARQRRVRAS